MQRLLSVALVVGLLVATAAAFAVTENLKLTLSPILRTRLVAPNQLDRARAPALASFSPVCRCSTAGAVLQFSLRKRDQLTLDVVDSGRHPVQRLVDRKQEAAGRKTYVWFGRSGEGTLVPDGSYQFQVQLKDAHRTILLPNRLRVDTHGPRVLKATPNHPDFSPDGDGQSDSVKIRYRLSERAHALLFFRGQRVVRTRFAPRSGAFNWYGKIDGKPLPQGTYRLRLGAEDVAGNVTAAVQGAVVVVHVRYITLAQHELAAIPAGARFGVGVETGAPIYRWRFAGQSGGSSKRVLVLRAPTVPGSYRLVVAEGGYRDAATVVVVPRP